MTAKINHSRRLFGAAALGLAASRLGAIGPAFAEPAPLSIQGRLPSLGGATGWLNTQPLTGDGLRGKVVLVNFCNYSCINWLRALPYVRAWASKYREKGLVTLAVHTPEFGFEKDLANVRRALKNLGVDYPVALDSDYAIWRAFANEYWPAFYFIDTQGNIRHRQFGEGDYDRSERVIQQLLAMAGAGGIGRELVSAAGAGAQAPPDWADLKTPETYVGYARAEGFASSGGLVPDTPSVYAAPAALDLNQWALAGNWTVGKQATVLNRADGRIVCRFHARDLHLVLGPPAGSAPGSMPARMRVLVDGHPPGAAHGLDLDAAGNGTVTEPRLYQLIRQPPPIVDRQFEIAFLDPGVEAFAFTFG
jgi:thiol-disulfide isomerase/thioredoxin